MLDRLGTTSIDAHPKTDLFGCPSSKLGKNQELQGSGIRFFRKSSDDPQLGRIATEADDRGFLVGVSRAAGHRRRIFHTSHATEHEFEQGSIYVRNLSDSYRADLRGAFDFILLEVSRSFLVELAREHGWRGGIDLVCRAGTIDPMLSHLVAAAEPLLENSGKASSLFIDQLGTTIGIYLIEHYAAADQMADAPRQTQLSRTQLATAYDMLMGHVGEDLSIAAVARACGLSRGYFIRGFKEATGQTPHQWVLSQRVEQARGMLIGSRMSLADIALACGFADQSHFTRVFSRVTGLPPGSWRRATRS
jgi:AraC family transcriptional regulator